ncbi:MAG: hypothetical protein IPK99_17960 [Flavobacteriales bacterium]|nr:hypothetical protein [Flavobacteriales bacterium]
MRFSSLALLLPFLLLGCGPEPVAEECPPETAVDTLAAVNPAPVPLVEGFLRTDGVYRATMGQLVYYIRFFPEGRAMLIGGLADDKQDLREALEPSTPTGGTSIVHNVPVRVQGDSIFFVTQAMKGAIDYAGMRHGTDSLTFRKYSHVTGNQVITSYRFERYDLPIAKPQ